MEFTVSDQIKSVRKMFEGLFYHFGIQDFMINTMVSQTEHFRGCILEKFEGLLNGPSADQICSFRKLEGQVELVCDLVKNELKVHSLLNDSPYFAKVVGFSLEESTEGKCSYIIAHQTYPYKLENVISLKVDQKVQIIFNLFRGLNILNEKGLLHGALSEKLITFDELWIPKIKAAIFTQKTNFHELENYLNYLQDLISSEEVDSQYLAPELLLTLNAIPINQIVKISSPQKCDLFSMGIICCIILGYSNMPKKINLSSYLPLDFEVLKTNCFSFEELKIKSIFSKLRKEIYMKYIELMDFVSNLDIKNIEILLCQSLETDFVKRVLTYKLIPSKSFEDEPVDESKKELILILAKETIPILIKILSGKYYDAHKFLNSLLNRYFEDFRKAYDIYYSIKCTDINIKDLDGLVIFFYHLFSVLITEIESFDSLKSQKNIENAILVFFRNKIYKKFEKFPDYGNQFVSFFETLLQSEPFTKNYITQSLLIFKLNDWNYFFSSSLLNELKFLKFTSCSILFDEFSKLIKKPIVHNMLLSFLPEGKSLEESLEMIIKNAYITKLFPSAAGFSTYNRLVFINTNFLWNHFDQEFAGDVRYRAAIYITMLHECAHLLRRFNFKTIKEAKNSWTPPNDQVDEKKTFESNFELIEDLKKIKGESGFKAEQDLFGTDIKLITLPAAEYLRDFEPTTNLQEFRVKFWDFQMQETNSVIEINRSNSERLSLFKCAYASLSQYHEREVLETKSRLFNIE